MTQHWENRDKKLKARKNKMPKHGRSLFTIEIIVQKKAEIAKAKRRKYIKAKFAEKYNDQISDIVRNQK